MRSSTVIALALLLAGAPVAAAGQAAGHQLLQQALVLERSDGDFEAAAAIYERIVREHAADRKLAARAMLLLAASYEKLGQPLALDTYRQILEDYPDREDEARRAAARLAELAPRTVSGPASAQDATHALLMTDLQYGQSQLRPPVYDISPDGLHLVVNQGGRLLISARSGSVQRTLVEASRAGLAYMENPIWSPDGRYIAFGGRPEGDTLYHMYVISPEGGEPRPVGSPRTRSQFTWAADGRGLVWRDDRNQRLVTRPLDDPARETYVALPGLPGQWLSIAGGYSPDGRWLAIHRGAELGVWIMPAEGGDPILVAEQEEPVDPQPTWGPDGRLYYLYAQGASRNLFRVAVDPSTGTARGEPEQVTFYEDGFVARPQVTQSGAVTFLLERERSTVRVGDAHRPEAATPLIRGRSLALSADGSVVYYAGQGEDLGAFFALSTDGGIPRRLRVGGEPMRNAVQFSPDRSEIAYVGQTDEGPGLFVVPTAGDETRELLALLVDGELPVWSPDGTRIAYGQGGSLFVVERAGGEPVRLATPGDNWESWTLCWSPDGRFLAYLGDKGSGPGHTHHVFVVPASGGAPHQVSPDESAEPYKEGLSWRPDGQALTYHVYQSTGSPEKTMMVFLDGRPPEVLVEEPEQWDYVGQWAPDGSAYYWIAAAGGLYRKDIATGRVTMTSGSGWYGELPTWSADGRTVALTESTTVKQLWMMVPNR